MTTLAPGTWQIARVVDLPGPAAPRRIALAVADRLILAEAPAGFLAGLAPGDLVRVRIEPPARLLALERIGGPAAGGWRETGDALRWRRPGAARSRMAFLGWRQQVLHTIRAHFDGQGFLEVETPVLVRAPSPEPQFAPVAAGGGYLITSPEFQLKRLLVGGFERIYRLGPVFRGGEIGRLHNPEFTLLEWYRAGAGSDVLAADLEALLARLAPLALEIARSGAGAPWCQPLARRAALLASGPFPRRPIGALIREHTGVDLRGVTTAEALRERALAVGFTGAAGLPADFERAFFALWDPVETRLGEAPVLVTEWPAPLASLARLLPGDPTLAERMELYAGGMELANGFAELTDPAEQRRRFEAELAARRAAGLPPLPLDEAFLAALEEGMPPAAGMALGVERLVMLVTGAAELRDVLPFAWDER
ncbi:MAG: EF-P lysine aminoacylase GenX [Candidatus Lambdaproteobacteria bacterium]|nr:EF-P lysine aminoacylase GenX [Candidatus Lambdaproteobacteria bacterium]